MIIAFFGGRIVVGDGKVFERGAVLVDGERVIKVSEREIPISKDVRRIPLEGHTLLPGFIDCHIHFCLDGSPDPIGTLMREHDSMVTLKAAEFARRALLAGVTSIRDMGGKNGIDLALRNAIRSGLVPGPRMLASGRSICMTGGHGWQLGQEADGPDEVMKAARQQIKAGADVVKLIATGGVMTPDVEPGIEQFTEEELRAGIYEAHKTGRKTAAHAMGTQGILNALRAGIDSIEHGVFLKDEAISLMVENGVPLVPTLSALYHIESRGIAAGIPSFAVEKTHQIKPFHLRSVQTAREAGILIAMGTDAGTPFNLHGENLGELMRLVEVGFSPMEAIRAATQIAAKVIGLEKELGTIEEGKLADLIVVEGNPLEDISLLLKPEAIHLVMQGGKFLT